MKQTYLLLRLEAVALNAPNESTPLGVCTRTSSLRGLEPPEDLINSICK
jgi:hypothetical protein